MKNLYKIILFFAIFQMAVVIVGATNVFPYTLYSDVETAELRAIDNPTDFLAYFFEPPDIFGLSGTFTFAMFITVFFTLGAAAAWATHSWTPVVVAFLATSFVPMMMKSFKFFNKLFYTWDVSAVTYLGLCIAIGIVIIAVITIVETPAQGASG